MTNWVLENLVLTGAGATAILFIAARLVPNEKLFGAGVWVGTAITAAGRKLVGKVFWEKLECAFLDWGGFFFMGVQDGLRSDNDNGKEK